MADDDGAAAADDPTTLVPGEPRSFGGGRYVVRRRLGAGNFATVYLAFDERLDVPVAVKLLADRWSWEPEVRGRFVQEARLLRSLNDPHVVQIRDIAETDDGHPYLVMDYATRGTVEQRMIELTQRGVRPDAEQLRRFSKAMSDALGFLHGRRIAHRDIKPSNLLLTADAEVADGDDRRPVLLRDDERLMLGDLGLAKDLELASGITVGVGTAGYMAPEQASAGSKIDTRTDIYAARAVLAQVASGEAPDPLRRTSNGVVTSGDPLPHTIPAGLARPILRGLDTDPELRPSTIGEWQAGIDEALVDLEGPPPIERSARGRRRRWAVAGAGVVVAAGVVSGLVLVAGGDDPPPSAVTTTDTATTTAPASSTTGAAVGGETTIADARALPVTISGPTELATGTEGNWTVEAPGATGGTWSWSPSPFEIGATSWRPGDFFEATLNVTGTFTLTLDVFDAAGNTGSGSITFTVT